MARSKRMRELDVVAAAKALVAYENPDAFIGLYEDLCRAVDHLVNDLSDPDRITGSIAKDAMETSAKAGLSPARRGSLRWDIIDALAYTRLFSVMPWLAGATKDELMDHLNRSHQSVSSAINDLMNGGWIEATGQTRSKNPRFPQTVWRITQAGFEAYNERFS